MTSLGCSTMLFHSCGTCPTSPTGGLEMLKGVGKQYPLISYALWLKG